MKEPKDLTKFAIAQALEKLPPAEREGALRDGLEEMVRGVFQMGVVRTRAPEPEKPTLKIAGKD